MCGVWWGIPRCCGRRVCKVYSPVRRSRVTYITHGTPPHAYGTPRHAYELKMYTPYNQTVALGLGSERNGGALSTAEGHIHAFGCSEDGRSSCLASSRWAAGTMPPMTARPVPASSPRATGSTPTPSPKASASPSRCRKYRRARSLVHDHPPPPRAPDASPRSFLTHHVANISTAIQAADAQTILNAASARARACSVFRMGYGVM